MINNKKLIYYIFIGFIFMGGLSNMFVGKDINQKTLGLFLIFLSILISPLFDKICGLIKSEFSVSKKTLLGIGLFFVFIVCLKIENFFASIFIMCTYWITIFYLKIKEAKQKKLEQEQAERERLEQEKQIIKKFDNLDSFIGHVISELLIETNEKFKNIDESLYLKKDNILDIKNIIIDFCNDTKYFNSIYEFDNLFNNTSYYERKINKHFSSIKLYAENKILNSSFLETYKNKLILDYPRIIENISNNIPKYSNNLLYKTIGLEDKKHLLYLDLDCNLYDSECENAFLYMTYLMLIGTCISELIFIEEKIRALKPESEFYKIILGMKMELKDINSVIEKSKPIYDEYYKNDLGLIDSNSPLYDIAVNTIIRKINDEKELVKDILKITNTEDYTEKSFEKTINSWLYEVSKEYKFLDIEPYITYKILKSVSTSDFNSFLSILSKTNEYIKNYDNYIKRHKIMSDRQRYLNGDFLKEKMEIKMSNDLKDVTSGKEFELFLERLFKSLGYKTIHNGKSGDQGADLIIEKNNYVYAVQAKCYTNKVSNTPIQEVVASLKYYNANQGVVVTNSTFTQGAQDLAKVNNVILIDGKALNYLIDLVSDLNKNIDILQKLKNSY